MASKITICNSVTSYLEAIFAIKSMSSGARCYRGESDFGWTPSPSIFRGVRPNTENRIFSELMVESPNEFSNDKTMFDKLVRAQHYGLPTRLLDVSMNPLVALYFSCNDKTYYDRSGAVYVFGFDEERVKFADSDVISLICNLARLSDAERNTITEMNRSFGKKPSQRKIAFKEHDAIKRLIQFVRIEKPYFINDIDPIDLFKYVFVFPSKNNRRVIAQSGAFVVAGLLRFGAIQKSRKLNISKLEIPKDSKRNILQELDVLNINSRSLFPEIEFTSRYIKEKWAQDPTKIRTD